MGKSKRTIKSGITHPDDRFRCTACGATLSRFEKDRYGNVAHRFHASSGHPELERQTGAFGGMFALVERGWEMELIPAPKKRRGTRAGGA